MTRTAARMVARHQTKLSKDLVCLKLMKRGLNFEIKKQLEKEEKIILEEH